MSQKPLNVLILCTGNSARSIIAEALIDKMGQGRLKGYSAGSFPKGEVNPLAIKLLEIKGIDTSRFRSKSWDEFSAADAPKMDFVITVCDQAAGESCPIWPGHPVKAHWGLPDPAAATGTEAERLAVFESVYSMLEQRIGSFVQIDFGDADGPAIARAVTEIGGERQDKLEPAP